MINTNPSMGVRTQPNTSNQIEDIRNTLTQLQSSSGGKQLPLPVLNNLLQLVQNLVKQLGDEKPSSDNKAETKKESDKQQSASPASNSMTTAPTANIIGTEGDDNLEGNHENNRMEGLGGDDRLFGRQGNDVIFGDSGDDRLYGGQGDDNLIGGSGDDYLAGGRGINRLSGGSGNDILNSRLGNDFLDGGSGTDTARIRANIDDYTITVEQKDPPAIGADGQDRGNDLPDQLGQPDNSKIVLTHKETGQRIEVVNTEKFRFDDVRLSLDEIKQRADSDTSNSPTVALSASQREGVLGVFGADGAAGASGDVGVRVIDNDGDGTISAGDTAVLATGNANSVSQQFKDLSDTDVASINNTPIRDGSNVNITAAQQSAIEGVTGLRDIHVHDTDSSETLSVGDIVTSPNDSDYTLTAADLERINSFQPPYVENLNPTQINAIAAQTGISDFRVDDNDLSGGLGVGDTVVDLSGNNANVTLTAEDLTAIKENSVRSAMNINSALKELIEQSPDFTDVDLYAGSNNARLGAGDIVVADRNNPDSATYTLTLEDEINNTINGVAMDSILPRVALSEQQQQELTAIAKTFTTPVDHGVYIFDHDRSGTLSAGDTIIPIDSSGPMYDIRESDIASNTLFDQPFDFNA